MSLLVDEDNPSITTIAGESGSGKTTLARLLLGVIQPTGAKVEIPCADFFYMRNGKIERFDCYPALNIMLKQMGVPPDFASAVKRSTQR